MIVLIVAIGFWLHDSRPRASDTHIYIYIYIYILVAYVCIYVYIYIYIYTYIYARQVAPAWPNDMLYIFPVVIFGTTAILFGLAVSEPYTLGQVAPAHLVAIGFWYVYIYIYIYSIYQHVHIYIYIYIWLWLHGGRWLLRIVDVRCEDPADVPESLRDFIYIYIYIYMYTYIYIYISYTCIYHICIWGQHSWGHCKVPVV